jgi:hypothetical protein
MDDMKNRSFGFEYECYKTQKSKYSQQVITCLDGEVCRSVIYRTDKEFDFTMAKIEVRRLALKEALEHILDKDINPKSKAFRVRASLSDAKVEFGGLNAATSSGESIALDAFYPQSRVVSRRE